MREEEKLPLGVGVSSLLMIFMVLTLTSLTLLALMTAKRQLSLSERGAAYMKAYYEADARAQDKQVEIIKALEEGASNQLLFTYEMPMEDEQVLSVELECVQPYTLGDKLIVKKWYVRHTSQVIYEEEQFGDIKMP